MASKQKLIIILGSFRCGHQASILLQIIVVEQFYMKNGFLQVEFQIVKNCNLQYIIWPEYISKKYEFTDFELK